MPLLDPRWREGKNEKAPLSVCDKQSPARLPAIQTYIPVKPVKYRNS
jgi:hypothetical protein